MEKKPRNHQWDVMRAIGIIAMVWGHNYQPPYLYFPAFFFQQALFFFVSGYFFRPRVTVHDKLSYFWKKTRLFLIPYFALNLFFGIFTMWLKSIGINLGVDLNLHSLFITPLSGGDQFFLYLAAWFILTLYFVSVIAGFLYQKEEKVNMVIVGGSTIAMLLFLHLASGGQNSVWTIFYSRTMFGLGFFGFGYLFKLFEPQIKTYLLNPLSLFILYVLVNILESNFGTLSYDILFGYITNKIFIFPVISTICIILITYTITYYITRVLKEKSIVYDIGEHSYSIMVWHLTIFFLVNVGLYEFGFIPFEKLSDGYFRFHIEQLWLLYQLPAILIPVFFAKEYLYIKQQFWQSKMIHQPEKVLLAKQPAKKIS